MRRSCRATAPAAALTAVLAALPSAPAAAASSSTPAARERPVVLQLYAVDTRLESARRRLASLDATAAELERQRVWLAARLRAARRSVAAAQRILAAELRGLYEESPPDPLAVFLGARSLQDAVDGVDDLRRASSTTESVVAQASSARVDVVRLGRALVRREQDLRALHLGAAADVASLERARADRAMFLTTLQERDRVEAEELARAAEARTRATQITARTAASLASVGAAPASGPTLVVVSTGYSLPGTTATGLPVGHGVAAVDPAVIPLGTRITIPGYGEAVAADTGPAISGVRVDLWFPTKREALAWGWRTLTVTLH